MIDSISNMIIKLNWVTINSKPDIDQQKDILKEWGNSIVNEATTIMQNGNMNVSEIHLIHEVSCIKDQIQ